MSYDFEDYKPLIVHLALSFNRTTGYDMDELVGIGTETFCQCLHSYDTSKANKFSTWLYKRVHQTFCTTVSSRARHHDVLTTDFTVSFDTLDSADRSSLLSVDIARQFEFFDSLKQMKPAARDLVDAIFKDPLSFGAGSGKKPNRMRGYAAAYLRDKGFNRNQRYAILREIKQVVNHGRE